MFVFGFGAKPPEVREDTTAYVPPGAMYVQFPGLEGIWELYPHATAQNPFALIEISSSDSILKGRFKFTDKSVFPESIYSVSGDIPFFKIGKSDIYIFPFNEWIDVYRLSMDFENNRLTFRVYGRRTNEIFKAIMKKKQDYVSILIDFSGRITKDYIVGGYKIVASYPFMVYTEPSYDGYGAA